MRPVWKWDGDDPVDSDTQQIELISPPPPSANPVVFVDVPCRGAFGDLSLDDCWDPPTPLAVEFVNTYHNSAIDEGPASNWRPRSGPGPAEAGVFRCITVGANRRVQLHTSQGAVYYWGALTCDTTSTCYLDGISVEGTVAFKHAIGTYYGDWNGDGVITRNELSQLSLAIAGGAATYSRLMDANCDGVLRGGNGSPELTLALANYAAQPGYASFDCAGDDLLAGTGMDELALSVEGEDLGEPTEEAEAPVDTATLAAWLIEQLSPEELATFVSQASVTADQRAGDAVGADIAELLSYLP